MQHYTGKEVIALCRKIVRDQQYDELDGDINGEQCDHTMIDMQTANAITTIHDALSDRNQHKMESMSLSEMADTSWRLIGKANAQGRNQDGSN